MMRLLVGLMLLPFLIAALCWALPKLVHWPDKASPKRMHLYRERAERLRQFIALDAPPIVVYQGARLLLSAEHGSDWRAILAWAAASLWRVAHFPGARRLLHAHAPLLVGASVRRA